MAIARGLIAGLAIAIVPFAIAQESTHHVDGSVVDADTGLPIEGARLQLFGMSRVPVMGGSKVGAVFTGKDGLFDAVIPVDARPMVQASAEGYITENSRAFLECSPCDVTFRLRAKAAFIGRVVAADNAEPIMYVQVDAFPFIAGELSKRSVGHVLTDSLGQFSLGQLPAGQYFLRFTPSDAIATLNLGDTEDAQSRRFLREWWPGGTNWQRASPTVITGGSIIRVPDVQLLPEARFTISGTVLPQSCHDDESFQVTLLQLANGTSKMLRSALVRCGADYAFSDLTSGTYQVAMDDSAGHASAKVDVQVGDENVHADLPVIARPVASGSR